MREPRKFNIAQLLGGEAQYIIPDYQRGYDWKDDSQVRDLFVDLISCIDSEFSEDLFLGTMIFCIPIEDGQIALDVIDGQQRITTIILLLLAARHYAINKLDNAKLASEIHSYIANSGELTEEEYDRLIASPTIGDVFHAICEHGWDGTFPTRLKKGDKTISVKRQSSKLKPIFDFCLEEIDRYSDKDEKKLKKLLKQVLNKTFVIRIEIDEKAEAFEIFERTNARGKGLEVSDLLKNFLFSKEKEFEDESIIETWDELVDGFGNNILRALKYFWISRKGNVTSRNLYRKLRYYAQEIGVPKFVDELKEFADYYAAYHSDDKTVMKDWLLQCGFPNNDMYLNEFRRACIMLQIFKVTTVVPFIFSMMKAFQNGEKGAKDPKLILTMLRTLESCHFVNNRVCNRMGNETEKAYTKYSTELYISKGLSKFPEIQNWFENVVASFDEFAEKFGSISYENKNDRMTIRYTFDKIVNAGAKDGQRIDLIDIYAYEHGTKPSYDIEHLMSQSDAGDDDSLEYVHEVGNLIVIPKQINGIMGNAPFETKMDMLRDPAKYDNNIKNVPNYLQDFVSEYGTLKWGEREIRERTHEVAKEIYNVARHQSAYK